MVEANNPSGRNRGGGGGAAGGMDFITFDELMEQPGNVSDPSVTLIL